MPETVVEASGLSVRRNDALVLSDINFKVAAGEVFALLGGNGAGKSTTLLTFLGLLKPSAGEAFVFGESVFKNVAAVRAKVAYLPEAASLYPHLSAYENLEYFLALAGLSRSRQAIDEALDRVFLQSEARVRHMESYSKGMRQKIAIALALLRGTPLMFLDEPTSGLDPWAIDEFNSLVTELSASGITIVMVTHDVYGACQVAHRIMLLQSGRLVGSFEAEDGIAIDTETVHAAFIKNSSR